MSVTWHLFLCNSVRNQSQWPADALPGVPVPSVGEGTSREKRREQGWWGPRGALLRGSLPPGRWLLSPGPQGFLSSKPPLGRTTHLVLTCLCSGWLVTPSLFHLGLLEAGQVTHGLPFL